MPNMPWKELKDHIAKMPPQERWATVHFKDDKEDFNPLYVVEMDSEESVPLDTGSVRD